MTPTQTAEHNFERALHHFRRVKDDDLSMGLQWLAMGLQHMAIGVRATYQVTDQVRQSAALPGRKVA